MTDAAQIAPSGKTRLGGFVSARRDLLRGYLSAVSGSAGRLVFSLLYFVVLANSLSIADYGLFATASAAGLVISRLLGFGFVSPLYRAASVKPQLVGTYTAGFLLMALLSLPLLAAATLAAYNAFFAGVLPLSIFALVVAAEVLLWRPFEAVVIVNNGLGRFGRGALLVIGATALRAAAAGAFALLPDRSIAAWAVAYAAANAAALVLAAALFYPRQRLRLRPRLYWRRLQDSVSVAASEVLFYLQAEFDKLLVLALGGPALAGIYAIVMRLVDLTAIPIRAFTMMLVQRMMRAPDALRGLRVRAGLEIAVFAVSTGALLAMAVVLHFFPRALGGNVAEAAPLIALALLIPGLRNLIEYHAELLYARGQTVLRMAGLGLMAAAKAMALVLLLRMADSAEALVWSLNVAFLALYAVSAAFTYAAMRRPAKTF